MRSRRIAGRRGIAAIALVIAALVAGCGTEDATDSDGSDNSGGSGGTGGTGESSLSFTSTTVDGEDFDAASLAGKPAVLWFWAPWCSTCAAQASDVVDVAKQYEGEVNVVGVASLGQPSEMAEFVDRTNTTLLTHLNDEAGAVWQQFGITEQSTFALIDADGAVTHTGYLETQELSDRVAELTG